MEKVKNYIDLGNEITPTWISVYKQDFYCNKINNILNDDLVFECTNWWFNIGHAYWGGFEYTLTNNSWDVVAIFKWWDMSSENKLIYKGITYNYFPVNVFENIKSIKQIEEEINFFIDVPEIEEEVWKEAGTWNNPLTNKIIKASDWYFYQIDITYWSWNKWLFNLDYINEWNLKFKQLEEGCYWKIKDSDGEIIIYKRKLELIKQIDSDDKKKINSRKINENTPDSESLFLESKRIRYNRVQESGNKRKRVSFYKEAQNKVLETWFDLKSIPRDFSATSLKILAELINLDIDKYKALKSVKYNAWSHLSNVFNQWELSGLIKNYSLYPLQEALKFYGDFYESKWLIKKEEINREWSFWNDFSNNVWDILDSK